MDEVSKKIDEAVKNIVSEIREEKFSKDSDFWIDSNSIIVEDIELAKELKSLKEDFDDVIPRYYESYFNDQLRKETINMLCSVYDLKIDIVEQITNEVLEFYLEELDKNEITVETSFPYDLMPIAVTEEGKLMCCANLNLNYRSHIKMVVDSLGNDELDEVDSNQLYAFKSFAEGKLKIPEQFFEEVRDYENTNGIELDVEEMEFHEFHYNIDSINDLLNKLGDDKASVFKELSFPSAIFVLENTDCISSDIYDYVSENSNGSTKTKGNEDKIDFSNNMAEYTGINDYIIGLKEENAFEICEIEALFDFADDIDDCVTNEDLEKVLDNSSVSFIGQDEKESYLNQMISVKYYINDYNLDYVKRCAELVVKDIKLSEIEVDNEKVNGMEM